MSAIFKRIHILLTAAAVFLSCSMVLMDNDTDSSPREDCRIIVSGSISDMDTNVPLAGIKVAFCAYPLNGAGGGTPSVTQTVYSDSNGIYAVEIDGISESLSCTIIAESPDLETLPYQSASQEVNINWSGNGYDEGTGTFFVNDCDFKLSRTE